MSNTSTMRWKQQSIDTKCNSKHHKQWENKHKVKQDKTRFSQKRCLLPLRICISPMNVHGVEFLPPKNVHISHIVMMKHTGILSPFLSRIDKWIKRKEGKKKKIWIRLKDDAWRVQDEWENETQTKDKII